LRNYLAKYCFCMLFLCWGYIVQVSAQCGLTLNFTEGPQTSPPNIECPADCDGLILVVPSGGNGGPFTYSWNTSPVQVGQGATGLCAGIYTVTITDGTGCVTIANDSIVPPPPIVGTITDGVACFESCNGTAFVTASGGCSGSGACSYPISWTNQTTLVTVLDTIDSSFTFTGLCEGDNYTLTVTDFVLCPGDTVNITIRDTSLLVAAITSSTNETCFGDCDGTATATGSGSIPFGGSPNYLYAWSDGQTTSTASALCGGVGTPTTYTVTVTDSIGCTATQTVDITRPPEIATNPSSTPPGCGTCNGTATPGATGGTGTLTYSWDDPLSQTIATAVGLCQGAFSVTITDANNCTETEAFSLVSPAGLQSTGSSSANCAGAGTTTASATVTVTSGTAPYTYSWNDALSQTTETAGGLTMGESYTVSLIDADGCTGSETITVVTATCPLIIPNTFSPNGDGFNDTWFIESLVLYTNAKVKVYNRWGDVVFQSTGYDTPWDGQFSGTNMAAAVYYYVIEVDELDPSSYAGQLTIVR